MVISNSHKFGVAWGVSERSRVPTFFYGWVILIINENDEIEQGGIING